MTSRTELAVEDETAFVRASLDALDDAFFVFDLDMEFVLWNEAVTGYTDEEFQHCCMPSADQRFARMPGRFRR